MRLLLAAVLLFGGAWPITKAALADASPLWFATGRSGLAAAVLAIIVALLGRLRLPGRRDLPAVFALGLLQLGGFFALAHLAVALVPAGRTAILSNVIIPWLVPLSVLLLGERVSGPRWLAAGLGLAGVAALAGPWSVDWTRHDALLGHGMLLLAALSWSLAIIAVKRWPPTRPMLDLLPWCFALGTLMLLPMALWDEPGGGVGAHGWPYLLFIGLVAAPIGTWCVVEASRKLPAVVASVGFLLVPAFGLVVSALWLGEPLGWDLLIGGALIVGSVVLAALG